MENKRIKNLIIYDRGPICMAGWVVYDANPLTAHHIVPHKDGGLTIYSNIAVVSHLPHSAITILSNDDKFKKIRLEEMFFAIKESTDMKYILMMKKYLLEQIQEYNLVEERTSDGLLIYHKSKYLRRK